MRTISKKTVVPKNVQRPIDKASNEATTRTATTIGQGTVVVEIIPGIALPSGSLPTQIGPIGGLGNTCQNRASVVCGINHLGSHERIKNGAFWTSVDSKG